MKKPSVMWRLLPFYVLILGAVGIVVWNNHQQSEQIHQSAIFAAHAVAANPTSEFIEGKPTRVLLPSLNIDAKVVDGIYSSEKKEWLVSDNAANYVTDSALPNNRQGRTIIYAHDLDGLFGPLSEAKLNDIAYVYTENRHILKYRLVKSEIVQPNNTQVFNELKGSPGIFLITCEGTWSQQRRITEFIMEKTQ